MGSTSKPITVLYAREDSIYKEYNLDVYDKTRDARTYSGNNPVIAHPPCRLWGKLHHLSKADPLEKLLALSAINIVRKNGGVLEHPAYSKLWKVANINYKGIDQFNGFTLPINQGDFGHLAPKATWLYICGIKPQELPPHPLSLSVAEGRVDRMSLKNREATPRQLAEYLIQIADMCRR